MGIYFLYDISKWNTDKVINLNSIFYNCSLLSSLPDISKWNTDKVINPLASPSAEAPALNYGDVNTETTSPGEVKGLI